MSPLRGWLCIWIRFYKDVAPMALKLRKRELIAERLPALVAWRRKESTKNSFRKPGRQENRSYEAHKTDGSLICI